MANIKISELPEASSFSTTDQIPIVSGGATKRLAGATLDSHINNTYIEPIENNVLGLQGTILWTNTNPTDDFDAQTITLDSSDYDMLEVFYTAAKAYDRTYSNRFPKGRSTRLYSVSATSPYISYRDMIYASDTSYSIESTQGLYSGDNSNVIPLHIVGYKTGLF